MTKKKTTKSWHEVVDLREDLISGELSLQMFAADLYEVLMRQGHHPIYEDPNNFFALTFPAYNLRRLVREVALRIAGENDKAVRQLVLNYGGGKTHTLITLLHLLSNPRNLPSLPSVEEFQNEIGQDIPQARVAGLCFDKLDVETGMNVRDPDGAIRKLKHPWSVLAYQLAGDQGLKLLHAEGKAEERESAPAENLLAELLRIPTKEGLGVLILIDEVLMYASEKIALNAEWKTRIVNFFQYLTQAVAKVDRCCIVASLLASELSVKGNAANELQSSLYNIFQRQREEVVVPVEKRDVAEVLRRRFFTPESIKDKTAFRPHAVAAYKGIRELDETRRRRDSEDENRFIDSYPFHPDLTEAFYSKWTQLDRFQKTRGILRIFAMALRESVKWDECPIIGPGAFLNNPSLDGAKKEELSEAMNELVAVADTEEQEGKRLAWTGILTGELKRARRIQKEISGLGCREIEQAVISVFLHSQPIGQDAKTPDLIDLIAPSHPDKIALHQGLLHWSQISHWLDDKFAAASDKDLPSAWRLGDKPNLIQIHSDAMRQISDDVVRNRLLNDIRVCKSLSTNARELGVHVHNLPESPRDIEDDGQFHYCILSPEYICESGKPSREAKRFLEETTSIQKPRVYLNAVILLAPSRDGVAVASKCVRSYLAWEKVKADMNEQSNKGSVDPVRMSMLANYLGKAKIAIPDSIRKAYCIVLTVDQNIDGKPQQADEENSPDAVDDLPEANHVIKAFKISVTDDSHFSIIKNDPKSRINDSPITAETLLPSGPYNLWQGDETSRWVKDLAGAFAQYPHLPKMLKADSILETLAQGCESGAFVLQLQRPDKSLRSWWLSRPDDSSMSESGLSLVLPKAAELSYITPALLKLHCLPELWGSDAIIVGDVVKYFQAGKIVEVERKSLKHNTIYNENLTIPKASTEVVHKAIQGAVEAGHLWLVSGPASILEEAVPIGAINESATIQAPPEEIPPAAILAATLPNAWAKNKATAASIAVALSQMQGKVLPWKTVKDAIDSAINARYLSRCNNNAPWPCEWAQASSIELKEPKTDRPKEPGGKDDDPPQPEPRDIDESRQLIPQTSLKSEEVQELGEQIPNLLDITSKGNTQIAFGISIQLGDGQNPADENTVKAINKLLRKVKDDLQFKA